MIVEKLCNFDGIPKKYKLMIKFHYESRLIVQHERKCASNPDRVRTELFEYNHYYKSFDILNLKRWHLDNCKLKLI